MHFPCPVVLLCYQCLVTLSLQPESNCRMVVQQAQLQKHMVQLQQIQKQLHIKSIPIEQQQSLQQDLLELQRIQMARQKAPDATSLQLKLIQQQQTLQEHLIELQQELVMMAIQLYPQPSKRCGTCCTQGTAAGTASSTG